MAESNFANNIAQTVSTFSDWPVSFLILAAGGLLIELLATRRASQEDLQQLFRHSIYLSRAFAIFVFTLGLICAAVIPSLPFKDVVAPIALWTLAVMLLFSASSYTKGSIDESRYWLIPQAIDRYVSPWRIAMVREVLLASPDASMKPDKVTTEVQKIVQDRMPNAGPLAWIGAKALVESSFKKYDIEKTLTLLVDNGECKKTHSGYSIAQNTPSKG